MSRIGDIVARKTAEIKKLDEQIARLTAQAAVLKARRDRLERENYARMEKAGLESVSDSRWTTSLKETEVPTVKDFDKFWAYVRGKNIPELMTRAVNSKAWRERGMRVPGVGSFTRKKLSITKRK